MKAVKILTILVVMIHSNSLLFADEYYLESERNRGTMRLEVENDLVWDDDSGFTSGWSLQYHTVRSANWEVAETIGWIKWIGQHLPTLDDEDAIVRSSHGIGQNMITPGDIQAEMPPDGDLPYAGTLTYTMGWQNFNRQKATLFQLSVGVLGPASLAEELQQFVHNELGLGEKSNGWDTQRETEPILNMGYQYAWSLLSYGQYHNGWATQLTVAPSASLGNLFTAAEFYLALRMGWNMQEGFTSFPAPPGRGFFQASYLAKPPSASPHGLELVLGGRCTGLLYSVIYDGSLITDDDRDIDRKRFYCTGGMGLFYHYYDVLSIRATIQRATDLIDAESIPNPPSGREKTDPDPSFGSLIVDIHF